MDSIFQSLTTAVGLHQAGRFEEAEQIYRQVLDVEPNNADACNLLGAIEWQRGNYDIAADYIGRAIQRNPNQPTYHINLGGVYGTQGKLAEAIACYRRVIELKPDSVEAYSNLAVAFVAQGKSDEAIACYTRVLQLKPEHVATVAALVHEFQHQCRWDNPDLNVLSQRVVEAVDRADPSVIAEPVVPFTFMALPTITTARQQLKCAWQYSERHLRSPYPPGGGPPRRRMWVPKSKLTVGYLSADFHMHATALLIAELFEKHDRDRFEVFAYSYGPDDGSPMRRRLVAAFDRFADVRDESVAQSVQRIAADQVDVLVDLKGHTGAARTKILALRAAPIQVNYLGYPGTMGADFVDYILVDDFLVPPEQQENFTERLVYLPGCYQVNDSRREISPHTPTRGECGLPDQGFVFCCFNNNYKITPEVFEVWMKLLKAVPGSVLWLLEGSRVAADNLRRQAQSRGITPGQLVFAPRAALPEHLARHRLADLFLDTFPVTAHTTASDALWAGCPLLTIAGETLISRAAGSLLRAIGLGELITTSLEEYEAVALRLAGDGGELAELRARLAANRGTCGLFDAGQFARNVEQAYATMWEIYYAGEQPRAFRVSPERPAGA